MTYFGPQQPRVAGIIIPYFTDGKLSRLRGTKEENICRKKGWPAAGQVLERSDVDREPQGFSR